MQRLVKSSLWSGGRKGQTACRGLITSSPDTQSSSTGPGRHRGVLPDDELKLDVDRFGFPRIPYRGSYELEKCEERRRWVERFTGSKLPSLAGWWGPDVHEEPGVLKGNIEGPIGLVRIPLACAGPILVHGKHAEGVWI